MNFSLEELKEEVWYPIKGFPNYEVSTLGRVRSFYKKVQGRWHLTKTPYIMKASGKRYKCVCIRSDTKEKKVVYIHHLVMNTFIGICPEGLQRNHKDGNKDNNRLTNLEYITQLENIRHSVSIGLHAKGERQGYSKMTLQDVEEIRWLYKLGATITELSREYNMTYNGIRAIIVGKSWAWT